MPEHRRVLLDGAVFEAIREGDEYVTPDGRHVKVSQACLDRRRRTHRGHHRPRCRQPDPQGARPARTLAGGRHCGSLSSSRPDAPWPRTSANLSRNDEASSRILYLGMNDTEDPVHLSTLRVTAEAMTVRHTKIAAAGAGSCTACS